MKKLLLILILCASGPAHAGFTAPLALYQGDAPTLAGKKVANYQAGYDTEQNQIYLNTQRTDLSQGGQIMASTYHEAQRVENQANPNLHGLTPNQQTNLAQLRGDRAAKVWNRLTPAATTPNQAATQAWNQKHQTALAPGTAQVAQSQDATVLPREYNINRETGDIAHVSEKGGAERQYLNVGTQNGGKFTTNKVIVAEGENDIFSVRFAEEDKSTVSAFVIPGDATQASGTTGFFLEPAGPSTTTPNQNKRIPADTYNLTKGKGTKFPDAALLYNEAVPKWRAVLDHAGNDYQDTKGCPLPGTTFSPNEPLQKLTRDAEGRRKKVPFTDNAGNVIEVLGHWVGGSGDKLKEIQGHIDNKGYDNVHQQIFDPLTTAEQNQVTTHVGPFTYICETVLPTTPLPMLVRAGKTVLPQHAPLSTHINPITYMGEQVPTTTPLLMLVRPGETVSPHLDNPVIIITPPQQVAPAVQPAASPLILLPAQPQASPAPSLLPEIFQPPVAPNQQ